MARIYDAELREVHEFMDKNERARDYADFQSAAVSKLKELSSLPELFGRVSDVYSRDSLKSRKKIAIKLFKWRRDWAKAGEARTPRPRIGDIHDIAALTVTCFYPSDVLAFSESLKSSQESFRNIFAIETVREIDDPDYQAHHFVLLGQGIHLDLRCEVQVKTVLAKDWGLKTHDLVYKPPGDIDKRLTTNLSKIGHVLKIVDDQSEIVRSLIEAAWTLDRRRRLAAQKSLLVSFEGTLPTELHDLLERWRRSEADLATAPAQSDIVIAFDREIREFVKRHPVTLNFCRLVCLYALSRHTRDRNDFALGYIDRFVESLDKQSVEYKHAISFQCNCLMSMEEYEECLQLSNDIIQIAEADGVPGPVLGARLNRAYYLSEAYYHRAFDEPEGAGQRTRTETDACGEEALAMIATLRPEIEQSRHRLQAIDTIGAVLISCGTDAAQVREGLELCREALIGAKAAAKGVEQMEAFYSLHERRAFTRLLHFD
jgi:ppGpp synthetase/RelA/SpoT-type nucleotidyltranferase